jgi:hypothetical protein
MVDMISPEIIIESIDKNTKNVISSICKPSVAILSRSTLHKEKYFPQDAFLDGIVGACKSVFSRLFSSPSTIPNHRNHIIPEKNLNTRLSNWKTLKKFGNVRMNNNNVNFKRSETVESINTSSDLLLIPVYQRLKKAFYVERMKTYIEELIKQYKLVKDHKEKIAFSNHILSLIDLNDKAETIIMDSSVKDVMKSNIISKLNRLASSDISEEDKIDTINEIKVFLRQVGISIGGKHKTRKHKTRKHKTKKRN